MDANHRFYSLNAFLRQYHGNKVMKLALDGGFTCPNRDGTVGYGGCKFCSSLGSGDFTSHVASITSQIKEQITRGHQKWPHINQYIAYFQSYTNTHAPLEVIKSRFEEALSFPEVVGLAIATRPDCLPPDVVSYLAHLHQRTHLWIELGLQSIHEKTAYAMNRGHDLDCYTHAVYTLASYGIEVVSHIILGLPDETKEDMLATAQYLSTLPLQGVKIHMLHLLDDAPLGKSYVKKPFPLLTEDEYVLLVGDILSILPPHFVIHRLTGDGDKNHLIAPKWTLNKRGVLNHIHHYLKEKNITQGCLQKDVLSFM